ncbi:hypothetical protein [Pedobacter nototheniae]|uniref:hypothetical protein n=1 Tax=Pedobacter nototheniae TaxID=2488994 RepID=UPI00292EEB43|nr:hypothetical protein [Pedobacter nototheniae]
MNIQFFLIIFVFFLLIGGIIFFFYHKKRLDQKIQNDVINLPPPVTLGNKDSVRLDCRNVKTIFILMAIMFWGFAIFFGIMMMSEMKNQDVALDARGIIDALTDVKLLKFLPFAFLAIMFYFIYNSEKISWNNGPVISSEPTHVLYFEIKAITASVNLIYLQSEEKLWILVPTTLEETKRFKDIKVLNEQLAFNETQVVQLKANLIQYGVQEKKFRLFPLYLTIGFFTFIGFIILIMLMLS